MTETLRDLADRQIRKQADARTENRRNFPQAAQFMDAFADFSPRLIFAEEGGRTIGREESGWIEFPKGIA